MMTLSNCRPVSLTSIVTSTCLASLWLFFQELAKETDEPMLVKLSRLQLTVLRLRFD